ncbi:PAS domain S-box protein [Candidatus Albibeggiatoa sp. nov. NOAA]|uniref:hybrid sensor histidine kinase/response regulator n=1 Tax=Candidatus Albibeggiatoa sp. nov. NOAA TaxID=3162724 RepID=UPI00330502CC|nr:PAS domain S-box protein [Thiotrichaceae bacterium]
MSNPIRQQAETLFEQRGFDYPPDCSEAARNLLTELAIQKIELEIQNQALTQEKDRLYHFNSIGYVYFDKTGTILQANPTAQQLLDLENKEIENNPFVIYLPTDVQALFHKHLKRAFATEETQICQLHFKKNNGKLIHLNLESHVCIDTITQTPLCCTSILEVKSVPVSQPVSNETYDAVQAVHYRQLFDKARVVFLLINPQNGAILDANAAACDYYGYSVEQFKDMYIHNINILSIEGVQREMYFARVEQRAQFYFRHRLASGEIRDVEVHSSPVTLEGVTYLYSVVHDITEWRKTEEVLQNTQDKLLETQKIGRVGYWELDLATGDMYWGVQTYHIFGLENEINPHETNMLKYPISPKNYEYIRRIAERAIREPKKKEGIAYHVHCPDGKLRYIQANWHIMYGDDSQRFVGTVQDVTELRETQLKLKESELRFSNVFDNSGAGIALLNNSGQFKVVNPALCRILGYSEDELLAKTVLEITHPNDIEPTDQCLQQLITGQIRHFQLEKRYIHQKGHEVWVVASASIVRDELNKPLYLIAQMQDISKIKETENCLSNLAQITNSLLKLPLVLYRLDKEGIFIESQGQGLEALHLTPNQLVGQSALDVYPQIKPYFQKVLAGQNQRYTDIFEHNGQLFGFENLLILDQTTGESVLGIAVNISEQVRAEQQLRDSETRLKETLTWQEAVLNNNMAGILIVSSDRIIHEMNLAALTLLGYQRDETIGKSARLLHVSYDSYEQFGQYYTQAMTTDIKDIEYQFKHKNGQTIWLYMSGRLLDQTNLKDGVIWSFIDITQRKQIEQALRQSEQRFDLAVQGAKEGIWDWDVLSGAEYYSPRFKQILGYKTYEMPHHVDEWRKRLHPDDYAWVLAQIDAYLNHELPVYELTYRMRHKDGHYIWVLDRGMAVWNKDGKAIRMVGTYTDLTEQKQAEVALQESESRFKAIFNNATVGISLVNLGGYYIQANEQFLNMLGYSHEEIIGKTFRHLTHSDDVNSSNQYFKQVLNRELTSYRVEKRFIRGDGQVFWVDLWASAIERDGELVALLGIIVDLNERKQAEVELQQAKELAEAANYAKTTFLANMSHELRTPLNAVLGYTQIFRQDAAMSSDYKDGINIIHRNAEYLLTLINDILDLSKIEAGRLELSTVDFDLQLLIQDINEMFRMRAIDKKLHYHYEPLTDLPYIVYGDEKRLRQILINLLSNAVKYTNEGGKIYFRMAYAENNIHCLVEDSGIGIDKQDLEKIFDPFQQAGAYYYRLKGTGLGLSITNKLIKMMQGSLKASSELGKGSVFSVNLPLPTVTKTDHYQAAHYEQAIIGFQGDAPTILVVDDKLENRLVLAKMLSLLGFKTLEAKTGQQAVKMTLTHEPALIFMDLVMPGMDGYTALEQIQQHRLSIPIIAVSASTFAQDMQKTMQAGFVDFIAKPINHKQLQDCLQKHLNLDWIYKTVSSEKATNETQFDVTQSGLSEQQIQDLYDFANMGDVQGILDYINALSADMQVQLETIRHLAEDIECEKICELLQQS